MQVRRRISGEHQTWSEASQISNAFQQIGTDSRSKARIHFGGKKGGEGPSHHASPSAPLSRRDQPVARSAFTLFFRVLRGRVSCCEPQGGFW